MEFKVRQVLAKYYRRKWTGIGICAVAVIYLIYLEIFRMDYRISLVVGWFASLLLTLSVFLVYFGMAVVMVFVLRLASTGITDTLTKDCDPFLYEVCLNRLRFLLYKDRVACNYAVARYYQGNFSQAWETLQHINVFKLKGRFKLNYYILLCALHFRNGTGERAAELEQVFRAGIRNKKDQKNFQILCAENNLLRAMENRDYESAFRFLKEREELNDTLSYRWHRVAASMKEAQIYAAMGENESAKLKLGYVTEHGGRLFYVEEARLLLGKITGQMEENVSAETDSSRDISAETETAEAPVSVNMASDRTENEAEPVPEEITGSTESAEIAGSTEVTEIISSTEPDNNNEQH